MTVNRSSSENEQYYRVDSQSYGSIEGEQYFIPVGNSTKRQEQYQRIKGAEEEATGYSVSYSDCSSISSRNNSDSKMDQHERMERLEEIPLLRLSDDTPSSCMDWVFYGLGFQRNPFKSDSSNTARNTAAADLRLSMLSNFSTAYNILSISLSLKIMKHHHPYTSANEASLCSSALLAGMIVGQLAGGTLGDILGRHHAMALVMMLQVLAALASAFSMDLEDSWNLSIYEVLSAWRFILGLGAGGVYPLAATLTAESSQSKQDRAKAVALTFSFQGVGYLCVPLTAWMVINMFGPKSDLSWRIILGLGAVPGIALTVRRLASSKSQQQQSEHVVKGSNVPPEHRRIVPVSVWDAIRNEPDLIRKLVGTGGCWLLFDVLFYGNTLFQPVVLSAAFGSIENVAKSAQDTALLALMALPGYFVSVFAVGRQSPWFIQIQGFFVMGLLYLVIGVLFDTLAEEKMALLVTYGSTFFFSNYGPNATTFMLPSMTFSKHCRSTLNGLCAAMGKVGAFLGSVIFVAAANSFGEKLVFMACAVLSFIGCFMTLLCVSPRVGQNNDNEQDEEPQGSEEDSLAPLRTREMTDEEAQDLLNSIDVPMKVVVSRPSLVDWFSQ